MNTTVPPTNSTPVPNNQSVELPTSRRRPSTKRRGLTRLLAVGLAAMSVGTAVGAMSIAQPVAAASSVDYCFRTRSGSIVAPIPTSLQLYYNYRWNHVATGSTNTRTGCGSFNMTGWYQNYFSKVEIDFRDGRSGNSYYGETPFMAYPGYQYANLGTGTLSCYGGPCHGA